MKAKVENSHIHLDIVGGIAGDMFISAMLDTFEDLQSSVHSAVALVVPANIGTAEVLVGVNSGISGLTFSLQLNEVNHTHTPQSPQSEHSHIHEGEHNEHAHRHDHSHNPTHSHKTTYRYLCQLISDSELNSDVIKVAIELLTIIGKAEAKIHNKTLDAVHFHELADWDSLMDVVAAAVILSALSSCSWSTSKLPIGGGLVNTQHGLIPVPAPATAEILLGFEFFDDNIKGERITPTGAAILRYLADHQLIIPAPQGQLLATGYGLGTKVFPGMPNILRAMHFDTHNSQDCQQDTVVIIECDIDDMTGEEIALSLDLLRSQQGVIDVTVQTARGKKNRAVELVRILASSQHYKKVMDTCFIQTTTIGLRYRFETRRYLPREPHTQQKYAYKSVLRPNGESTQKIEHDELTSLDTLSQRRAVKYKVETDNKKGHS
ncbi:LarC family nickel insertion protein [Paraglaciecola sp. L3A3]|uniref:LarC family nickel insertion protein n=1 Tax=Paraglaciecola sp. L3A3 TaxID=2686358 RepID=UPI00131AB127|nr:LarC family nickel insertion protein [Paraglaciecola sp. L3A3]